MKKYYIYFFIMFSFIIFGCSNIPEDKIKVSIENKITELGYVDKIYYRNDSCLIGGWKLAWDLSDEDYKPQYSSFFLDEEGKYQFKIVFLYFDALPVPYYTEFLTYYDLYFGNSYNLYFDGYSLNFEN